MRVLGENARIEIRANFLNAFNVLNINPSTISTNIVNSNLGQASSALGSRMIDFQARFSFSFILRVRRTAHPFLFSTTISLEQILIPICLLKDEEGLLLFSLIGDQSFEVVTVLHSGQHPPWRTKVHQDPRTYAAQLRDAVQHADLMAKDIRLVFFSPAFGLRTVQSRFCVGAEFTDDQRLVIGDVPDGSICILGPLFIPSDVLVGADHIESVSQRVVDIFIVAFSANQQGRCHQARGIEVAHIAGQGCEESRSIRGVGRLVGDETRE